MTLASCAYFVLTRVLLTRIAAKFKEALASSQSGQRGRMNWSSFRHADPSARAHPPLPPRISAARRRRFWRTGPLLPSPARWLGRDFHAQSASSDSQGKIGHLPLSGGWALAHRPAGSEAGAGAAGRAADAE